MTTTPGVSTPAVWFLLAVVIGSLLLVVFYMYFTKKACFKSCTGCDWLLDRDDTSAKKSIAESFDDSDSSDSSDSDEETYRNIQKAIARSHASLHRNESSSQEVAGPSEHPALSESYRKASPSKHHQREEEVDLLLQSTDEMQQISRSPVTASRLSTMALPAMSQSSSVENWKLDDAQSVYSREISSSLIEEDEVAAAMAVKPPGDTDDDFELDFNIPISSCGTLDVALQYFLSERKLQITILDAKDLPSKDRGGTTIIQVHAVILPAKRKRYKTKVQHISSPRFAETFKLSRVAPENLRGLGLRVRLYGIGKVRDRLIGEATLRFDEVDLIADPQLTVTLQLEPRTDVNRGDLNLAFPAQSDPDASSAATLAHGGSLPEILLSLLYSEMTGRLCVEVVKGSHFRNLTMSKPPDTHVKLVLLNSACQEMAQSRTTVRRSQPNPVFKETFYFQVALFQLAEVSLMVSVYCNKTIKRKSMLGWISMGRNSSSEADEQHWVEMREAKGKSVSRWHTLIES